MLKVECEPIMKRSLFTHWCLIGQQSDLQRAVYMATNTTLTLSASQRITAKEQFDMLGTGGEMDQAPDEISVFSLVFTFANWLNNCKG